MAKIQDKDRRYSLLRFYVDFMFKTAYRRVAYYGKEKIPQKGAIIYAPNHTNTLMDALAVLAIDRKEKVFVSRADIFKNPLVLKFLTFLKMLPINRKRDGVENLAKNEEVNNIVVDALHDQVPFCILPEGTHRTMHSLMPLQKGLFRIALQANDTFGNEIPVYIVPVGIEFGHFFRYRSSLLVQIGDPIDVTQYVRHHSYLTIPVQITCLKNELSERIKELILHIPDDTQYQATKELSQLCQKERQSAKNRLIDRFAAAKETIQEVASLLDSDPQKVLPLLNAADDFSRQREALGIGMASVLKTHLCWTIFGRVLFLFLGLPLFVASAVATSLVTLPSMWLCSKFKDNAFHNTVRFLVALALLPLILLIAGPTIALLCSWMWGVLFALLLLPSFLFLHEYIRWFRLFVSDVKYITNRDLYKKFNQIKSLKL